MKDWVRDKLNQVHELYPPERLRESKARWQAVWERRKPAGRYPFVFQPVSFDYYNDVFTKEEGLRAYLDEFIARGFIDDDFIPAFFPGCRQGTIPGMFGAKELVVGKDYTSERILFDSGDIHTLPDPAIRPGTPAYDWLEMQRYYLEECDGELPVHVCDMQGPVDAAGQMFGYDNLFLCAYDDEDAFRLLLSRCGDAFCMLWKAQQEQLGEHFVATHLYGWDWVPAGEAASLSADSLAMISGDFFREFYAEVIASIAARLGKLAVHSCGDFSATLRALGQTDCIHAVNASQMTVEQLLEAGWPPEKMIILQELVERAETVLRLAAKRGLSLDVCFTGLWPRDEAGYRHPNSWTGPEKEAIMAKAAAVAAAARRAVE